MNYMMFNMYCYNNSTYSRLYRIQHEPDNVQIALSMHAPVDLGDGTYLVKGEIFLKVLSYGL